MKSCWDDQRVCICLSLLNMYTKHWHLFSHSLYQSVLVVTVCQECCLWSGSWSIIIKYDIIRCAPLGSPSLLYDLSWIGTAIASRCHWGRHRLTGHASGSGNPATNVYMLCHSNPTTLYNIHEIQCVIGDTLSTWCSCTRWTGTILYLQDIIRASANHSILCTKSRPMISWIHSQGLKAPINRWRKQEKP